MYDETCTNDDVYLHTGADIVAAAMDGIHGTVFVYGQTATGKTHTMTGGDGCPGIIELAVNDIFQIIEKSREREFLIHVSYLEIYMENVIDLLGDLGKHLQVRTDKQDTVFVVGLGENVATSIEDVMNDVRRAGGSRQVFATLLNSRSSRSHAIFRLIIESHLITGDSERSGGVQVSHLNFVDLAGSENVKESGMSGKRRVEAGVINKSLLALAVLINQLNSGVTNPTYRNSKLTRILKNAIGGNSKTAIICTINPAEFDQSETTLRFAKSAQNICNKPVVNKVVCGETMITITKMQINRMNSEIADLKKQLNEMDALRQELGSATKRILELEQKQANLEAATSREMDALRQELGSATKRILELEQKQADTEEAHLSEVAALKDELEEMRREKEESRQKEKEVTDTYTQLRRVLGMINYYHRFVNNCASSPNYVDRKCRTIVS